MSDIRQRLQRRRTLEVTLETGAVFVRVLSLGELASLKARFKRFTDDVKDFEAVTAIVLETVCEADGSAIFTAEEIDQVKAIDHDQLLKIFAAAVELNGLSQGKAYRPRSDSNTGSPSPSAAPSQNSDGTSTPTSTPAGDPTTSPSRGARRRRMSGSRS